MSGLANSTGAVSGVVGTTVGTPVVAAGTCFFIADATGTWATHSAGAVVPFTNIKVDDDSCCSVTGGTVRFTAPATGFYLFGFSIYTAWSDESNTFGFEIDGVSPHGGTISSYSYSDDHGVGQVTDAGDSSDEVLSLFRVYKLTASQYVTVCATSDSDTYAPNISWHGCRIG